MGFWCWNDAFWCIYTRDIVPDFSVPHSRKPFWGFNFRNPLGYGPVTVNVNVMNPFLHCVPIEEWRGHLHACVRTKGGHSSNYCNIYRDCPIGAVPRGGQNVPYTLLTPPNVCTLKTAEGNDIPAWLSWGSQIMCLRLIAETDARSVVEDCEISFFVWK